MTNQEIITKLEGSKIGPHVENLKNLLWPMIRSSLFSDDLRDDLKHALNDIDQTNIDLNGLLNELLEGE